MNPLGCNTNQLNDILSLCGYDSIELPNNKYLYFFKQKKKIIKRKNNKNQVKLNISKKDKSQKKLDPNSPFAVLEKLL